ncbi:MAG: ribulokinase [Bacteroidota bacterium]
MDRRLCIGLDFGTDSVRAVLVDSADGQVLSSAVAEYERWRERAYCDPRTNRFRQHPEDHFTALQQVVNEVMNTTEVVATEVKALCLDATGSSPIAVDAKGKPLTDHPEFADNPNAMVILWKDHTATAEAAEINALANDWAGPAYTSFSGGVYSSEWFWAKMLHIHRIDPDVCAAAHTWMEHCDLLTFSLVGGQDVDTAKRSRCAAGHKAMWHSSWGGYPAKEFLGELDPSLARVRATLPEETYTSQTVAGRLCTTWAKRLGLTENVQVAVGLLDAHAGAVGAGIQAGTLVKVMGTSTCDMLVAPPEVVGKSTVRGISGQVDGSILPGMIGFEAGQSAFGDVLDWFRRLLFWPLENLQQLHPELAGDIDRTKLLDRFLTVLGPQAEQLPDDPNAPLALDWLNGRRTPEANQLLTGALANLSLGTDAAMLYRGLVESICFGAKRIADCFTSQGVEIKSIMGIGGVANKSSYIMQMLADIHEMPIHVTAATQAGGLGAAMLAATAAKIYPSIHEAIQHMGQGTRQTYYPDASRAAYYAARYRKYQALGQFVEEALVPAEVKTHTNLKV